MGLSQPGECVTSGSSERSGVTLMSTAYSVDAPVPNPANLHDFIRFDASRCPHGAFLHTDPRNGRAVITSAR
jgi:hypothetical protein